MCLTVNSYAVNVWRLIGGILCVGIGAFATSEGFKEIEVVKSKYEYYVQTYEGQKVYSDSTKTTLLDQWEVSVPDTDPSPILERDIITAVEFQSVYYYVIIGKLNKHQGIIMEKRQQSVMLGFLGCGLVVAGAYEIVSYLTEKSATQKASNFKIDLVQAGDTSYLLCRYKFRI